MDAAPEPAAGHALVELVGVMARLRRECPWKAGQTHRSLARYLLEETHEVLEALDTDDATLLREELGDLLLQVYFHAAIAAERTDATAFTIDDVAADLTAKLVRRNPHVFAADPAAGPGDGTSPLDAAAVNEAWEAVKATEKTRTDPTDGLPPTLPALLWADKVLDRSARAGTPLDPAPRAPRADADADAIGDRLLGLVAEARAAGVDPEQALRDAVRVRL
ncbi:XTP/dITP diphosphohydrolase [Nocardioides zeae]|uniref:XTP/dITP diphosphohydrolase n=2 Tax=Nocardioides zeae TaxID=1457234 RepID=A0ACC6ID54_9ACTN|nr:MazG family protein [Nocardioides zeae]MDQ1104555.1 XTP/dITP diphosphohydrolase [Nocardioides zeae]MDR6175752.1 XTP/dITP diphosphohydrolase [Nocardioides zeae]MDR6208681.1 XTP/dITP diphosphohydrolase [Nocardioides zeae]